MDSLNSYFLPKWIQNVKHIPHVKTERILSAAAYDAVSKLEKYLNRSDSPEKFVRMYDDVYFTKERKLEDLEITRYLFEYGELRGGGFTSGSVIWHDQVLRSADAVRKIGFPGFMTETHCPEVFEKSKMKEIFEMFEPADYRLLTSTLYYNVFPYEKMLKDRKTERALFYGCENEFSYKTSRISDGDGLPERSCFMNHNDEGLDNHLKRFITIMFPDKCRFER